MDDLDDLISRQAAMNLFAVDLAEKDRRVSYQGFCIGAVIAIDSLPSAEKTGKWIDNETSYADRVTQTCTCSVCGRRSERPIGDYCRWCGARMVE